LAPDAADASARMSVDRHLIGGAVPGGAEEEPAIGHPVIGGLERDLDIAEAAVADQEPAIPRRILAPDDDAVHNPPIAAALMSARCAVRGIRRDMPAGERPAVEQRDRF